MLLTQTRIFKVGKGPVILYIYIAHCRAREITIIGQYPNNKMRYARSRRSYLRKLLDKLSPGLEIGRRIDNPARGIDYVEAINEDIYFAASRQYRERCDALNRERRVRVAQNRKVKKEAIKESGKMPEDKNRRIELNL